MAGCSRKATGHGKVDLECKARGVIGSTDSAR